MWTNRPSSIFDDRIESYPTGSFGRMDFDPWNDDPEHYFDDDPAPPPLSLTPAQQAELAEHIGRALHDRECDGTLSAARRWARASGISWSPLRAELDAHGVYCDCELLGLLLPDAGDGSLTPTSS